VSGTSAYRKGEFLYQDFLYDDHGARGSSRDPNDPREAPGGHPEDGDVFAQPNGTYTYPTARKYANNAADLVEFRVKPLRHSTAFRITLNTMKNPSLVGTTIAIGGSKQPREFPHGANATAPARLFLTVHGRHADLRRAGGGKLVAPGPHVSISKRRRQIQVLVPHRGWNPRRRTVRLAAGVGLWDRHAHRYLIPDIAADATHPGGAAGLADPTAFFNAAFRFDEPWQHGFASNSIFDDPAWWRDREQGNALAHNDLSPFSARVSFAKLARGVTDEIHGKPTGVPTHGPMDRILVSHFETEQGADYSKACGEPIDCQGELRGRLQPYAIYVPSGPRPRHGYGLTLLLHSLNTSYNQFGATRNQSQLGDRGPGSVVIRRPGGVSTVGIGDTRGRTRSRFGRMSPADTGSTRAGRPSPATRWAATGRTSSRRSTRTSLLARTRWSGRQGSASGFRPLRRFPVETRATPTGCCPPFATSRS
jgi:C-terminal binding-module, SLH-like, of glucodextranase